MPYKIKEMRLKNNMSQEDVCKAADISRQTLSDLESGRNVNTTTQTLVKIANVLGCKVSDIFCA